MPLFLTVGRSGFFSTSLEKINPDEVTDITSFLTFIVVVVQFVMLIYGGLAIVLYNEMMNVSGGLRSVFLPLASLSWVILVGTVIGLAMVALAQTANPSKCNAVMKRDAGQRRVALG